MANQGVDLSPVYREISNLRRDLERETQRLENIMNQLVSTLQIAISKQTSDLENNAIEQRKHLSRDIFTQTEAVVAQAVLQLEVLHKSHQELINTKKNITLQTEAELQIELAKKVSNLLATQTKIASFVKEVDSRFNKSIEGVYLNRQLYNHNFQTIFDEYTKKIRTIAQHIYDIIENDFCPATNAALIPNEQICDLPMEVDLYRLKVRSESLNESLELLKTARLDDILLAFSKLNRSLEETYRVKVPSISSDTVYIVPGIIVSANDNYSLFLESKMTTSNNGSSINISFVKPENDFKNYHTENVKKTIIDTINYKTLQVISNEEKQLLINAGNTLLANGKLSFENIELLNEFLNNNLLSYSV